MESSRHSTEGYMSREEMRAFAKRQLEEIDKYKWCLGEQLGHDPLYDRSYDQIACEWISLHGAEFRDMWRQQADALSEQAMNVAK